VSKVCFFRADSWGRFQLYKEIDTLPQVRGADVLDMAKKAAKPGDLIRYGNGSYFDFNGETLKAVTGRRLRNLIVL